MRQAVRYHPILIGDPGWIERMFQDVILMAEVMSHSHHYEQAVRVNQACHNVEVFRK